QTLSEDEAVARAVVGQLAFLGQVGGAATHEPAFDEPVRSAGGQHEQAASTHGARAHFGVPQQHLAFPFTLPLGVNDQAGHFGHAVFQIVDYGHASVYDAVVLQYREAFDVTFEDGAPARQQGAVVSQVFDQLHCGAEVTDLGRAQAVERFFDQHGTKAVVRENFEQHRNVNSVGQQV